MTLYDCARHLHIAVGTIALIAFWTTAVLSKGTPRHRFIGRIYMLAILAIIITSLPLAAHAFLTGQQVLGIFLIYLVLITGTAVWTAWRAVRRRASPAHYIAGAYRPLAWTNLLAGFSVLAIGIHGAAWLLIGMSAVGLVVGYQMLRFAAQLPTIRQWWLRRHYIGIVGSGIATHIAFLNLGLSHLVPAGYAAPIMYLSWFGPLIAGVATVRVLNKRYEPRRSATAPVGTIA